MTILRLADIDLTHVKAVKDNTPDARGDGKTIGRLLRLLSRNRRDNYGKHYLFVTETRDHADSCLEQMENFLYETCRYSQTENRLVIHHPNDQKPFVEKFKEFVFLKPRIPVLANIIQMTFVSAGGYKQHMRGTNFSEIIFDVSNEGYRNNFKSLHNIMKLSPNLYE